jgi:predicted ABC-type ATPase
LYLFAGPNGSGKTSIFRLLAAQYDIGPFISVDNLRARLAAPQGLSLHDFHASLTFVEFKDFYERHPLRLSFGDGFPFDLTEAGTLTLSQTAQPTSPLFSYAVAVLADYVRTRLVEASETVSFETVLSHPSKLAFIRQAKENGYRVYLFYVCVISPEVSKQRVALQVKQGGLAIPEHKIVERYGRSLALLREAVALSDRAYLFDNTYSGATLKLEIKQATEVIAHETQLPEWITRNLPALVVHE